MVSLPAVPLSGRARDDITVAKGEDQGRILEIARASGFAQPCQEYVIHHVARGSFDARGDEASSSVGSSV